MHSFFPFTPFTTLQDIANIEQELNDVQHRLSENEMSVKRYKEEMELLRQLWMEQEVLLEKLESERLEENLEQLLVETAKYEAEMKEVKQQLGNCENDIVKCRENISELMRQIEERNQAATNKSDGDALTLQQLRISLQEKTREIESQVSGESEKVCQCKLLLVFYSTES